MKRTTSWQQRSTENKNPCRLRQYRLVRDVVLEQTSMMSFRLLQTFPDPVPFLQSIKKRRLDFSDLFVPWGGFILNTAAVTVVSCHLQRNQGNMESITPTGCHWFMLLDQECLLASCRSKQRRTNGYR